MSSKGKNQRKDINDGDVEQNRRPERSNRKKAPLPIVSDSPFEAEEVSVENLQVPKSRIYEPGPQKQDPSVQENEEEDDGKLQTFGADEASVEGLMAVGAATGASTTRTHRTGMATIIIDSSHATTEHASPPPNRPQRRFVEEEHHAYPGAERVGGYGSADGHASIAPLIDDNDTTLIGGNDSGDDVPIAHTSVNLLARAQLVEDPVVVAEVGADRTEELELRLSQEQHDKKRQKWIAVIIVLFLVAVIIGIISFVLVERGDGGDVTSPLLSVSPTTAPTSNPTAEPTTATTPNPTTEPTKPPTSNPTAEPTMASTSNPTPQPTSNPTTSAPSRSPTSQQEAAWISLIQSRMPSTTFEDSTSPQSRALDWMLEDDYTKSLNDNHRIIQRYALAVLDYSTDGPTSWIPWNRDDWLSSSTECDWGQPDATDCTTGDVVDKVHLFGDGLIGSIPREIGLLSALTWLDLKDNKLEGTIPSEVGLITSLTELYLRINKLEGTIPSEVGLMAALTRLDLDTNVNLSGRVPTELANLTNLEYLFFYNTTISGSIPSSICYTGGGNLFIAKIDCGEIECDCCTDWRTDSPC